MSLSETAGTGDVGKGSVCCGDETGTTVDMGACCFGERWNEFLRMPESISFEFCK